MSLRISLLIQRVLGLIGTSLDRMDFLMAARKDLDYFLGINIIGGRDHREISQKIFCQFSISPLVNPDSFRRLRETVVIEQRREEG